MPIAVTSHVGRDLLQNAAYYNSAPKVVMEYVSNSIDNAPEGQTVRVDVEINNSEIVISDNASGMSQDDLIHFFTMHGINRQRKRGRKVRGRFGTGKSAAFGIADGLRVETVRDGRANMVDLHRERILSVPDGGAIPVEHVMKDKVTDQPNGTRVIVYDLQLDKIFITPIRERLERALGRHLDMHEVIINNRRLKYRRPDAVETFTFDVPEEILERMPDTSDLKISVAREALTNVENGIAVLSNGFLNAMTLGAASGKAYTERIFGEVEVPNLDDEHDDEHFPAFDNTRDLSLNQQNPRAALVLEWIGDCVEQVRKELDLEAQLERLSEVNSQMQDAADFVGDLINADFARVQRRLQVATQSAVEATTIGSSEVVEIEVERPADSAEEFPLGEGVEPAQPLPAQPLTAEDLINYDEPDEPDAVPVEFEEPEVPELKKEEVTPDEAYESFVEYMSELDHLEEQAYLDAVIEEAQQTLPEAERSEYAREALTSPTKDKDRDKESPVAPPSELDYAPPAGMGIDMDTGTGNGNSEYNEPATTTEYHSQHVVSDHEVLVTGQTNHLQGVDGITYEERWVVDRDSFVSGGNPDAQAGSGAESESGSPSGNGNSKPRKKYKKPRRRTYFHIEFEHMGDESPRSRFAEEGRTIYINRDHPQVVHTEDTEGVESLAYKSLMNEIVIQEYASAVVRQMASTGFYVADPFDAVETIQAVVNRLALEAGVRLLTPEELEEAE